MQVIGARHVTGAGYHRNMAPPLVNIIIERARPDPGLNYAET